MSDVCLLVRLNESAQVVQALETIGLHIHLIDGTSAEVGSLDCLSCVCFLLVCVRFSLLPLLLPLARERLYSGRTKIDGQETEQLRETVKPEVKRKVIGDTFMRSEQQSNHRTVSKSLAARSCSADNMAFLLVFFCCCSASVSEEEVRKFGLDPEHVFLAQGTLRPDLIESASALASVGGKAEVIKTHHNDTQLVRELRDKGRIIEPLKSHTPRSQRWSGEGCPTSSAGAHACMLSLFCCA